MCENKRAVLIFIMINLKLYLINVWCIIVVWFSNKFMLSFSIDLRFYFSLFLYTFLKSTHISENIL